MLCRVLSLPGSNCHTRLLNPVCLLKEMHEVVLQLSLSRAQHTGTESMQGHCTDPWVAACRITC